MTDNHEWEKVCKEFCRQFNCKLLFVNNYDFGCVLPNQILAHIYADELPSWMERLKGEQL